METHPEESDLAKRRFFVESVKSARDGMGIGRDAITP
jgi:hypothetical protein